MKEPKQSCCEKCFSTYTDHTYPVHVVYDACINSSCECHSVKGSWEERLVRIVSDLEVADDFIPSKEVVTFEVLHRFFSAELLRIKKEIVVVFEKEKYHFEELRSLTMGDAQEIVKDIIERKLL